MLQRLTVSLTAVILALPLLGNAEEVKPTMTSCADAIKRAAGAERRIFKVEKGKLAGLREQVVEDLASGKNLEARADAMLEMQALTKRAKICVEAKATVAKKFASVAQLPAALGGPPPAKFAASSAAIADVFKNNEVVYAALRDRVRARVRELLPALPETVTVDAARNVVESSAEGAVQTSYDLSLALATVMHLGRTDLAPRTVGGRAARDFFTFGRDNEPTDINPTLGEPASLAQSNLNLRLFWLHTAIAQIRRDLTATQLPDDGFQTLEVKTSMVEIYLRLQTLLNSTALKDVGERDEIFRGEIRDRIEKALAFAILAASSLDTSRSIGMMYRFVTDWQTKALATIQELQGALDRGSR